MIRFTLKKSFWLHSFVLRIDIHARHQVSSQVRNRVGSGLRGIEHSSITKYVRTAVSVLITKVSCRHTAVSIHETCGTRAHTRHWLVTHIRVRTKKRTFDSLIACRLQTVIYFGTRVLTSTATAVARWMCDAIYVRALTCLMTWCASDKLMGLCMWP